MLPDVVSWYAAPSSPVSKFSASTRPGSLAAEPPKGVVAGGEATATVVSWKASMLPTAPDPTAVSNTRRIGWTPAASVTVLEIGCQFCQPPVFGMVIAPVTSVPFASRWKVPPGPDEATMNCAV